MTLAHRAQPTTVPGMPNTLLHIFVIDDALEAQAIRSAAEAWNYDVRMTWVGHGDHFVEALGQVPPNSIVVIAAHGEDGRIILPELAPELAAQQTTGTTLGCDDLPANLALTGVQLVICTACTLGHEAMGQRILAAGACAYAAPKGYPEGDASLMYGLAMLYALRPGASHHSSLDESHLEARMVTIRDAEFELWQPNVLRPVNR